MQLLSPSQWARERVQWEGRCTATRESLSHLRGTTPWSISRQSDTHVRTTSMDQRSIQNKWRCNSPRRTVGLEYWNHERTYVTDFLIEKQSVRRGRFFLAAGEMATLERFEKQPAPLVGAAKNFRGAAFFGAGVVMLGCLFGGRGHHRQPGMSLAASLLLRGRCRHRVLRIHLRRRDFGRGANFRWSDAADAPAEIGVWIRHWCLFSQRDVVVGFPFWHCQGLGVLDHLTVAPFVHDVTAARGIRQNSVCAMRTVASVTHTSTVRGEEPQGHRATTSSLVSAVLEHVHCIAWTLFHSHRCLLSGICPQTNVWRQLPVWRPHLCIDCWWDRKILWWWARVNVAKGDSSSMPRVALAMYGAISLKCKPNSVFPAPMPFVFCFYLCQSGYPPCEE